MKVNDHARNVLFSRDLRTKLRLPPDHEPVEFDPEPGFALGSTDFLPGRPEELVFTRAPGASRAPLPSRPSLVTDRSRGILLHFFANHELLAAELMALALLKFSDAPEEFRRGLFATLLEEQKHALWYLGRMKECSVAFGEFPLSRFFWDTVAPMESPLEYVTRLSLTFEQANLDYSLHFGQIMEEAGDPRTARIMKQIYRDEISHVGYGLTWFRRWKNPAQTDWEAYRTRLTLPLSPSRAKANGAAFNEAGRREAGLDEDFVRRLAVYEKSRGRAPNLFLFNPDAEDVIASRLRNEKVYQPGTKVRAVIHDLEILLIFLARQDDVVLMRNPPSLDHLERLKKAGFQLPEIVPHPGGAIPELEFSSLIHRKLNSIRPWSAAPDLPRVLGALAPNADHLWRDPWNCLFSKSSQVAEFAAWMSGSASCDNFAEAQSAIDRIAARNDEGVVLKHSHSAAGRGVRFFDRADDASLAARQWFDSGCDSLVVEPFHQRVFDFSVQFEVTRESIRRIGFVRQSIGLGGRYCGSISSVKFCKGLDASLSRYLMEKALPMYAEKSELVTALRRWADRFDYAGPLGVDAYVHRQGGSLALRPLCEINPRHTMGRVAHEIRRAVASGHSVRLNIERAGARHREMEPAVEPRSGKMCGGALCLNEIERTTQFAAVLRVEKTPNGDQES